MNGTRNPMPFYISLLLLALAYIAAINFLGTITQNASADGIIGVVFGLYICSHPAANLLDYLFYHRRIRPSGSIGLVLNSMMMFLGWVVIFVGTMRFVSHLR